VWTSWVVARCALMELADEILPCHLWYVPRSTSFAHAAVGRCEPKGHSSGYAAVATFTNSRPVVQVSCSFIRMPLRSISATVMLRSDFHNPAVCLPTWRMPKAVKVVKRWPHEAQTQEQLLTAIFLHTAGAACLTEKLAYRARYPCRRLRLTNTAMRQTRPGRSSR
jgi:hypothetical protein